MDKTYIDLGLPSGTKWADTNEEGYYTFDESIAKFGETLPTKEDFQELYDHCDWLFDVKRRGMRVIGPNGMNIFLPACGCRDGSFMFGIDNYGSYWSSSPNASDPVFGLIFTSSYANPHINSNRYNGFSVRLIKR